MDIDKLIRRNTFAKLDYMANIADGASVYESNNIVAIDSGTTSNIFNMINCKGLLSLDNFYEIKQQALSYEQQQKKFTCLISEESTTDLPKLSSIGIKYICTESGMYLQDKDLIKPSFPAELQIKKVSNKSDISNWAYILKQLAATDSPAVDQYFTSCQKSLIVNNSKLSLFVGFMSGVPVATAATFLGDNSADITDVITIPAMRNQGIASAMTYHTCLYSIEHGYNLITLSASEMGVGIYYKLGFKITSNLHFYQN